MNGILFVIILLVISAIFGSSWLAMISIGALFLISIALFVNRRSQEQSRQAAPSGGRKHKLIQAPQEAWDEDETFTYLMGLTGTRPLPINAPEDPLKSINSAFGPDRRIPADVVRNILPFRNYGRETVFEQIFIGLPINIGSLIKKSSKK